MSSKATVTNDERKNQEERLSKKHIQTLGYVQELMKENKRLTKLVEEFEQQKLHCDDLHAQNDAAEERIKKLQQQYLDRADEINAELVRKHEREIMTLIQEKLDAEKQLSDRSREMSLEIERLLKLNTSLEEALAARSKMASNQLELSRQNDEYKEQIEYLQQQVLLLTKSNENQLNEIEKLNKELKQHKNVKDTLASSNQVIKALENQVKQLTSELAETQHALKMLKESEIKSLKEKLMKALNEVSNLQGQLHQKEAEVDKCKVKVREVMDEVEKAHIDRYKAEQDRDKLHSQVEELRRELALLKSKGKAEEGGSFKEFVSMKRELVALQDENHKLKERLNTAGSRTSSGAPIRPSQSQKQRISLKLI